MKINLRTCSDKVFIEVLSNFSSEAMQSMSEGNGFRAGLYIRRINEALVIRKIKTLVIDDIDISCGFVYTAET